MISIVSAGVKVVLILNNNKKNVFSSLFGSFSLYLKILFLQENCGVISVLRVTFNHLCWATPSGVERVVGEWLGPEVGDGWWTKKPLKVCACTLASQTLLIQRTASFPSQVTCALVALFQCCWIFVLTGQVREKSGFHKKRTSQRLFSCTLLFCHDARAQTVAGEEGKSGIFPHGFWPRDWS